MPIRLSAPHAPRLGRLSPQPPPPLYHGVGPHDPRRSWSPPRQQAGQQGRRAREGPARPAGGEAARRSVLAARRPAVLLHPQVARSAAFGRGGVKGGGGPSLPRLLVSALTCSPARSMMSKFETGREEDGCGGPPIGCL